MTAKRPATIAEYIAAAPEVGQPHLQWLYAILKSAAPDAGETLKWNTPFFVEPRFLFAFSAHRAHLNFTPNADGLAAFQEELKLHRTTQGSLQVAYSEPLPEDLIRRMAEYRVQVVSQRKDNSFW